MKAITNLFHWYFTKNSLPHWCIFLIDCLFVFFSALFVCTINCGPSAVASRFLPLLATLAVYTICYVIGFVFFRTYAGVIRYSSFVDLLRISVSMALGLMLSVGMRYVMSYSSVFVFIRFREIVMWTVLATLLIWMVRAMVKYVYDTYYTQSGAQNVFIYGIKNGGVAIAKSLRNQDPAKYKVAGFVSDPEENATGLLMGVNIYPFLPTLIEKMQKAHATALFVSPLRHDSLRNNQEMVNILIDAGIKIFIVPQEREWDGHSNIQAQTMREVEIEDLLPREKIEVDMDAIGEQLRGKRILITGAAGSIGSEMVKQVAIYDPAEMILID